MLDDFVITREPNPHPHRTKRLLEAHPDVRRLVGNNAWTASLALALVGAQLGLAFAIHAAVAHLDASWPWQLGIATVAGAAVGAHVVHALYAVIHETAHRLVFGSRVADRIVALLCNVPLVVPFAVALSHYHLVHHRRQGEAGRDPDLPALWERRLFRGGWAHKLAYAGVFPLAQLLRPVHPDDRISLVNPWLLTNVALQLLVGAVVVTQVGWASFGYLLASVYFWSGPHPVLFARFVQEHFVVAEDGEETHSYYGPMNRLTLNIGYHVEHHDLPSVPWNRLPAVTRRAPELYRDRARILSWTQLGLRYLFDPALQVTARVARAVRTARVRRARPSASRGTSLAASSAHDGPAVG